MIIFNLIQKGNFSEFEEYLRSLSVKDRNIVIDSLDENGFTPLHFTCARSDTTFSKLLLQFGANPNVTSFDTEEYVSSTPIQEALDSDAYDNVDLLLTYKANPDLKNGEGKTTLILAIESGKCKSAQLIAFHSDLSSTDLEGSTALHWSASKNQIKIVLLLLSLRANPNSQNALFTPFIEAGFKGNIELCKILKHHGAKMPEISLLEELQEKSVLGPSHILKINKIIGEIEKETCTVASTSSIIHSLDLSYLKGFHFKRSKCLSSLQDSVKSKSYSLDALYLEPVAVSKRYR